MILRSTRRWTALLAVLASTVLAACAGYSPDSLAPRSSITDARAELGAPTGEYALPGGGKRLEFVRGPMGLHTYMLDFDAAGSLVTWHQALYEENFATVKNGMAQGDVLVKLGHPAHQYGVYAFQQTIWAYRFDSPHCLWFLVGLNPQNVVASTSYGLDTRCEAGAKADRD